MTERPIRKLLIANRGEIACRIMRTCEELGIKTVAVYSEADRNALHVESADEAVFIGPPEARLSYLDGAKIIGAAQRVGADAIHPGYGFLSENADFAQAVIDAGIVWVGPHPKAMRDMGSKTYARRLAKELGVPVVPGYDGDDQTEKTLAAEAKKIGYPLMIKASAGGGGRGIRIVRAQKEFAGSLKLAKQEALAAFGDDRVIVERYVEEPRHVEVQVMGDKHGNLVHLFTRDCSIQRRHQKLIEEAPAPNLSDAVREGLHEAALTLARAIKYDNAGTVEFLYDTATEQFYFLEMNTRLQVEHPVTEEITKLDLVELQLIAACGQRLRTLSCNQSYPEVPHRLLTQKLIEADGFAIEARICAEVPHEDFRPDSGKLAEYAEPHSWEVRARFDSGVDLGDIVSPFYDSMLAKVISKGKDREEAIGHVVRALGKLRVAGVRNNIEYLSDVLKSEPFRDARISTRFLEEHFQDWKPKPIDPALFLMVAAVAHVIESTTLRNRMLEPVTPWETLGSWRLLERAGVDSGRPVVLELNGDRHVVHVLGPLSEYRVRLGEDVHSIQTKIYDDAEYLFSPRSKFQIDDISYTFEVDILDDHIVVTQNTDWLRFRIVPRNEQYVSDAHQHPGSLNDIHAPYPGLITEVLVQPGDAVEAGDHSVVMEAMKMIQHLAAQAPGVVKAVHCQPKQSVAAGVLLIEFEKEDPVA